jgi:hypothetical protein
LRKTPNAANGLPPKPPDCFWTYSKNRITDKTLELLLQLAAESGLREKN